MGFCAAAGRSRRFGALCDVTNVCQAGGCPTRLLTTLGTDTPPTTLTHTHTHTHTRAAHTHGRNSASHALSYA